MSGIVVILLLFLWAGVSTMTAVLIHEIATYLGVLERRLNMLIGEQVFLWEAWYENTLGRRTLRWFLFGSGGARTLATIGYGIPICALFGIAVVLGYRGTLGWLGPVAANWFVGVSIVATFIYIAALSCAVPLLRCRADAIERMWPRQQTNQQGGNSGVPPRIVERSPV